MKLKVEVTGDCPESRQKVLLRLFERGDESDGAAIAQMALTLSTTESNVRNLALCLQLIESLATDPRILKLDPKACLAAVLPHAAHPSPQVRQQALQTLLSLSQSLQRWAGLGELAEGGLRQTAAAATGDDDAVVLLRGIQLTAVCAGERGAGKAASIAVDFLRHPDRRVRTASLTAITTVLSDAHCRPSLGPEAHAYAVGALNDDCQEVPLLEATTCRSNAMGLDRCLLPPPRQVRLAAMHLLFLLSGSHPEEMVTDADGKTTRRLVDDVFAWICNLTMDIIVPIRVGE